MLSKKSRINPVRKLFFKSTRIRSVFECLQSKLSNGIKLAISILSVFGFLFFINHNVDNVFASKIDELKTQIGERSREIERIDEEIAKYESELATIEEKSRTLQTQISKINLSLSKTKADIKRAESAMNKTQLEIEETLLEISAKEEEMENNKKNLAETLREVDKTESESLVEIFLKNEKMSDFFGNLKYMEDLETSIGNKLASLREIKNLLEEKKKEYLGEKLRLAELKDELNDRKAIEETARLEKKNILTVSRNKETEFQKILEEKRNQKEQFEKELMELESSLRITIDPESIPAARAGILKWPFSEEYMKQCRSYGDLLKNIFCLTQYFGNTKFAQTGAYGGQGHNGVDFKAAIGTKIYAALGGIVKGVGDTDTIPKCYSYGKWVLIEHPNGLSSLYAHLSLTKASLGQEINTGDLIGYSGNSGYSTGPHLHFTVYATQGVEIKRLGDIKKITKCAEARIPIAPLEAYLDPLNYL
ncbi:MAG: peptidoglycan DD-metalloendopeptidase family protein [Candidatus Niyogibacteria bacterium]|nr:peptidoglycan DD-metalloendopeptidase family protein [Candidatus Niyogibacteria bacterium]